MDLYRLSGTRQEELEPLNLPHTFRNCLSLIEWPNRLPLAMIPAERLEISITIMDDDLSSDTDSNSQPRAVTLTPFGIAWNERLHTLLYNGFIDDLLVNDKGEGLGENTLDNLP
jgi:tRNA A37 threonylcarbamoyladenosine biosynthesis protein TsaE